MKTCTVTIEGATPFCASRQHNTPANKGEQPGDWEERTWREKAYYDDDGKAFIPGIAFKMSLDSAAKYLGIPIKGKGKQNYTKHFNAGVMCSSNLSLGVTREQVQGVTINANSDGVRGSGKRVPRTFPKFPKWRGELTFLIFDDIISRDVFEQVITGSGQFVGVGQNRPEKGGTHGRFLVKDLKWTEH